MATEIALDQAVLGRFAVEVCRRLRRGSPPVYPGHGRPHEDILTINPLHPTDERTRLLIGRLRAELGSVGSGGP